MWFGAIPDEAKRWRNVKIVLTDSNHLKTSAEIQSHLQMEEERLKMFDTPKVALVAKGNKPKGNNNQ